jgi:hypothetical protein
MTKDQALAASAIHLEDGLRKHPHQPTPDEALCTIRDRLDMAEHDLNNPDADDHMQRFARRILQAAGICLKTAVQLDLQEPPPPQGG